MSDLSKLPNIGVILEKKLIEVEVNSAEELRELGSKEVYTRIRALDNTVCL